LEQSTTPPTLVQMRAELEAALASANLQRAPALSSFLRYICEEHFQGRADQIKEYTIAVEALGRPADFQPAENPIVRVQAARLRECLKSFYSDEGRDHALRISLPKGQYAPKFRLTATPQPATPQAVEPVEAAVLLPTAPVASRRRWILLGGIGALAFMLAVVFFVARRHTPLQAPAAVAVETPASTEETVRILAGSSVPKYIDQLGRTWSGDRYYRGGHSEDAVYEPLVNVEDANVWKHIRGGESFEYEIPLRPGAHELHLYFTEPVYGIDAMAGGGETSRIFDVFVNGQLVLDHFDILGDAGGPRIADEKIFSDIEPGADGLLRLRFVSHTSDAIVSAIEVLPATPHRMNPLRITARSVPYSSPSGVLWTPDRYFSGGRIHPLGRTPTDTDDPGLYAAERFGNFTYTFPVPQGSYTAVLHFSESYHGPSNAGGGGAGSRIFNVYFNGTTLLKDFDIYKEAGGPNRALLRQFHGLRPNAQGKLVFTFQPIRNYPSVNAIEILPE